MTIADNNIKDIINKLKNGAISREDVSNWAYNLMILEDKKILNYEPKYKKNVFWDIISELYMIDEKISENEYLFSIENTINNILDKLYTKGDTIISEV